jgi:hypothetical protein
MEVFYGKEGRRSPAVLVQQSQSRREDLCIVRRTFSAKPVWTGETLPYESGSGVNE